MVAYVKGEKAELRADLTKTFQKDSQGEISYRKWQELKVEQDEFTSALLDFMEFSGRFDIRQAARASLLALMKGLLALEEEKIGFVNLKPVYYFTFEKFYKDNWVAVEICDNLARWLLVADEYKMPWLECYIRRDLREDIVLRESMGKTENVRGSSPVLR